PGGGRGVEVVQARARRRLDELLVAGAAVAALFPLDAGLRVVAVGRDLPDGARAVLRRPPPPPHAPLPAALAPPLRPVAPARADADRGLLAGARALGPGVAGQAVGEQAERVRQAGPRRHAHALGAVARLVQRHDVLARRQLGVDGPAGA